MDLAVHTVIDSGKCIGCGICVRLCPYGTISMQDGKAVVSGAESLNCGHCMEACPVGAVTVTSLNWPAAKTFTLDHAWLKPGSLPAGGIVRLLGSLQSCRNYAERPVAEEVLEDLVAIGTMASSGSNSQEWTFTILQDRNQVRALAGETVEYFRRINRLAENRHLRKALRLVGRRKLDEYYTRYYRRIQERIENWDNSGKDSVFHGAPAAILVGATALSRCPKEDALIAAQNIRLAAHTMGLGSCFIGFAVQAVNSGRTAAKRLGLAKGESIHAAIALGWPDENEHYTKTVARKKIIPRYPDFL